LRYLLMRFATARAASLRWALCRFPSIANTVVRCPAAC
jgi:hypothetical protein